MTRAWLMFVAVSVLTAFLASCIHSWFWATGLSTGVAIFSLITGAAVSGFVSRRRLLRWTGTFWLRSTRYEQLLFIILFAVGAFAFLTVTGDVQGLWRTSSPNNLGDLPFHVHLIEFFAKGAPFPPANPIYSGEPLRYAYAIDLWDALWVKLGLSFHASIILTGLFALLVTLFVLGRTGGFILMSAFFFSGGLVSSLHWDAGFGPSAPLVWKNLFFSVFVTQRGFLWALPAGLTIMRKWHRYLNEPSYRLNGTFIFLWAIMPFFHLHSFVFLSAWIGITAIAKKRIPWKMAWFAWLPLFFILRSVGQDNVNAALKWNWAWEIQSVEHLFRNFGVWLLVPVLMSWRWIQQRKWTDLAIAWGLTFFAINLQMAPWAWDQIKIILWMYLLWTFWALREFKWQGKWALLISAVLFWPGFMQWLSGWPSRTGTFEIQSTVDRASLQKLFEGIPVSESVAIELDTRHPMYGLGQSLVLGYPAAVWSHGLPAEKRREQLRAFLGGSQGAESLAQEMGVKWIIWKDNGTSPPAAWSDWGWVEKRSEGKWHLWGKAQ